MEVVSAKVPDELFEWLNEEKETVEKSRSSLVRDLIEQGRETRDGTKIVVDLTTRDVERLENWSHVRGFTREEGAETIIRDTFEIEKVAEGEYAFTSDYIEELERENADLRRQVENIENPGFIEWLAITRRQPATFKTTLWGGVITILGVLLFFMVILAEETLDTTLNWIPEIFFFFIVLLIGGGIALFVLGLALHSIRQTAQTAWRG